MKRYVLTIDEYNTVADYTSAIKIDGVIDICHNDKKNRDYFYDFEEGKTVCLRTGFKELWGAVAYPLKHDIPEEEAIVLTDLFKEFVGITDEQVQWCLSSNWGI